MNKNEDAVFVINEALVRLMSTSLEEIRIVLRAICEVMHLSETIFFGEIFTKSINHCVLCLTIFFGEIFTKSINHCVLCLTSDKFLISALLNIKLFKKKVSWPLVIV